MFKVEEHKKLPKNFFIESDSEWLINPEIGDYIQGDIIKVSQAEVDAYYNAANELYDMFVNAGQYIIDNNLFEELGIDERLIPIIKHTWENDNHWHLYGRFDIAGGIDGNLIKLIEFNADTATSIPECSIIQWAHLIHNELNEDQQFNNMFQCLISQFEMLKENNPDKEPAILFTYMDSKEDQKNVEFIAEAAKEAGFDVEFRTLPEIVFSDDENDGGVWVDYGDNRYTRFDFWFKLLPWEYIVEDEPQLLDVLTKIVTNEQVVILNPAYTMLFQSKAILKILWDLYPNHPYLLETSYDKLQDKSYVEKVILGREGANVKIVDLSGDVVEEKDGDYGNYKKVYQEYVQLPVDDKNQSYQAGLFFAGEGAGLCFRRGSKIINDTAQFVSHYIE
jgi:glutathionylspermidine synthase